MFVKVVPNTKGINNTYFCYLVESYRENGRIKHRTIRNFGLLDAEQVPFLKLCMQKRNLVSFMMTRRCSIDQWLILKEHWTISLG